MKKKMLKELDNRIEYCEEQKRRLVDFVEKVDSNTIDYAKYKFYLEHYLQDKSPEEYLEMLDDHVKECKQLRDEKVNEIRNTNSSYASRAVLVASLLIAFLFLFSLSIFSHSPLTGFVVGVEFPSVSVEDVSRSEFRLSDPSNSNAEISIIVSDLLDDKEYYGSIEDMLCMINSTLTGRNTNLTSETKKIMKELLLEFD
ncbi:hypothetical protein HN419_01630 [Candidatus Woesearchaeota archaeon]|nr:hypothetical protein [Candidatus Woesearchaeota archaeon]MBT7931238.1 hypothetical protein [Candidatus Woesearchaeota archaeon]